MVATTSGFLESGSTLHLAMRIQSRMQIFVKTIKGKTIIALDVASSDTVESVKAKLQDEGCPLCLIAHGYVLEGTLAGCNVGHKEELWLVTQSDAMLIFVKTTTGKTVALGVSLSDTIESAKAKLQDELDELQDWDESFLVLNGEYALDGWLLWNYANPKTFAISAELLKS
jgi:hypothetical protein